jgi:4-aminobutyrate aminotransferase/(S)-3-amino-2-methylpropionate transaminase
VTSKTHPYKSGFEPFATEVYRIPYAYCYRCSYSKTYPSCGVFCAHHLEDTFKRVVAAESVAAVIVEPVLGEGGFVVPPPEFLPTLHDHCKRNGILMFADEVQSGFGRTGRFFACERLGLEPDLLVSAKSLGGGFPLAAVTGRSEVMDASGIGALGGTFGGHPVSCAAALAAIEALEHDGLLARSDAIGERFHARAAGWKHRWPMVGDVRGVGAMRAIELVRSPETREPAKEAAKAVAAYCHQHGLVILTAGTYDNVIRVLVPLTVTEQQLDEGLAVMEAALSQVHGEKSNSASQ